MSNYIRRFWKARAGTNLNKFTKSSETASSVILENAPDAITEAGTLFTAAAMQNIEDGVENLYSYGASVLASGVSASHMAYYSGFLYVCAGNKIVSVNIATGEKADFITGFTYTAGITVYGSTLYISDDAGTVYAAPISTGIKTAVITGLTHPWPVYAADGFLYVGSVVGVVRYTIGTWATVTVSARAGSSGIAGNSDTLFITEGDNRVYAVDLTDYSETPLVTVSGAHFYGLFYDGLLYAADYQSNGVYEINTETGAYRDLLPGVSSPPYGIASVNNALYVSRPFANRIDAVISSPILPASVLPVVVTSSDVTVTEDRFGTVRLTGALTGNRVVYLPAAVWKKTIICDCTGSYYVRVLATGQTTGGVYLAPGDAADVYCNGTNIVMGKLLKHDRTIIQSGNLVYTVTGPSSKIPLSSASWTGDKLQEIADNRWTPKNDETVNICGFLSLGSAAVTDLTVYLYENGTQIMNSNRNVISTATTSLRLGFSFCVAAKAGKYYELYIGSPANSSDAIMAMTRITPL